MNMNERKHRLVLPCADDDDGFRCYMCDKNDFQTVKNLYYHMVQCHHSDWRNILPEELTDCSSIIVRHKLFDLISSEDSDEYSNSTINDDDCCSIECRGMFDLKKFLPEWSVTGKETSKRGRPEVVVPPAKKLKVAEAADTKNDEVVGILLEMKLMVAEAAEEARKDEVLPESVGFPEKKTTDTVADMVAGGGIRVVFDFDLNEPGPKW